MKIVITEFLPFTHINLFGTLFVRKGFALDDVTVNKQRIRTAQIKEMLYVFYYVWFALELLVRLFKKGNACRNVSFEREVNMNRNYLQYPLIRPAFSWLFYLKHGFYR